jgi:hypothetical protein
MTVWVVTHWSLSGDEEETSVVGVFSSEEKAKAYIKSLHYYPANNDYLIDVCELDELAVEVVYPTKAEKAWVMAVAGRQMEDAEITQLWKQLRSTCLD